MKYLFRISVAFAFLLIFAGAKKPDILFAETINIEKFVSDFNLNEVNFKNNTYVLIQFWAGSDPQSRMENVNMHNELTQAGLENLQFLSISFDESEAVFRGIVKSEQMEPSTQIYLPKGEKLNVLKEYCSKAEVKNWLISNQGKIVAENISPDEVFEIVSH